MIKFGGIDWLVVDTDADKMFVLSADPVNYLPIHNKDIPVTWEKCSLRKWLNNDFIKRFNRSELSRIVESTTTIFPTGVYEDTYETYVKDKVFLLNYRQAEELFKYDVERLCFNSEDTRCYWWLLPIGNTGDMYCYCDNFGQVTYSGCMANDKGGSVSYNINCNNKRNEKYAVRPAMWIKKEDAYDHAKHIIWKDYVMENDELQFGFYETGKNNETHPLVWKILEKKENRALIITKYGLEIKQFNNKLKTTNWNSCSLRKWLNNDFYNMAISDKDKPRVLLTGVITPKTKYSEAYQGKNTMDKVFLLSIDEVNKYFDCDVDRICKPSPKLAKEHFEGDSWCGSCRWWLRNVGVFSETAAYVDYFGEVMPYGAHDDKALYPQAVTEELCVRPAMWISLD